MSERTPRLYVNEYKLINSIFFCSTPFNDSNTFVIIRTRATNGANGDVSGDHQVFYERRWHHYIK